MCVCVLWCYGELGRHHHILHVHLLPFIPISFSPFLSLKDNQPFHCADCGLLWFFFFFWYTFLQTVYYHFVCVAFRQCPCVIELLLGLSFPSQLHALKPRRVAVLHRVGGSNHSPSLRAYLSVSQSQTPVASSKQCCGAHPFVDMWAHSLHYMILLL